jgi:hypothetical protein
MGNIKIGRSAGSLAIEPTRSRETPKMDGFSGILKQGAGILLAGAQGASTFVGGPFLSAAIARARVGSDTTVSDPATGTSNDPLANLGQSRMTDEIKLLSLQNEIQKQDRQISLVSNVMKARHDTAKAAIGNIRS